MERDRTEAERDRAAEEFERMTPAQREAAYVGKLVQVDNCGLGCCGTRTGIITEVPDDCYITVETADGHSFYMLPRNIIRMHKEDLP